MRAADRVLQPPNERSHAEGEKLSEVIAVGKTPLDRMSRVGKRVLVEPKELAVAGEKLDQPENRHAQSRHSALL